MNRPVTTASNLFRRYLCPGSARMEEGLPEEESEFSREGQLLHDYYAHPEYERSVLKPHQRDLLESADALTTQALEVCTKEIPLSVPKCYTETTLSMLGSWKFPFTGTPDRCWYYLPGEAAIVLDVKFGYVLVERAEINLQLRSYAVLSYDFSPTRVTYVGIIQPRAPYDERISLAQYTPEQIEDSRKQIISILQASEKEDAPLRPSEASCRYCKAKMICPAFQSAMLVPTGTITPDKALSKAAREAYLAQKLAECDDEQLEKVYVAERLANMIHDPLGDEIRKRVAEGKMTNFSVAKDSEVREIVNVREAMSRLSLAGFTKDETAACVTKFSVGQVDETIRKKNPGFTWKDAKEKVDKMLGKVIELQTRKGRIIRK